MKTPKQSKMPDVELVKLAAILAPDEPGMGMEKATEFYKEAIQSQERKERLAKWDNKLGKAVATARADLLEFDPKAYGSESDEARRFLFSQGRALKKAQTVIDNIRKYIRRLPESELNMALTVERVLAQRRTDGTYLFPRSMLKRVAEDAKERRSESKHKGWKTRKGRKTRREKSSV